MVIQLDQIQQKHRHKYTHTQTERKNKIPVYYYNKDVVDLISKKKKSNVWLEFIVFLFLEIMMKMMMIGPTMINAGWW